MEIIDFDGDYVDERMPYRVIKWCVLESVFDDCRDNRAMGHNWSYSQVLALTSYYLERSFQRPVEELMSLVVQFTLHSGWFPAGELEYLKLINALIDEHGLDNMLADIPRAERNELIFDMGMLGLIERTDEEVFGRTS